MARKKHPVVLRFEGMFPADITGYEVHRKREGCDLGHIHFKSTKLPDPIIGPKDWANKIRNEINEMRVTTFAAELDYHERRKDQQTFKRRLAEGPKDPWRKTRHGPMREVILTANKEWFAETESSDVLFDDKRQRQFEAHVKEWLIKTFGDDLVHARSDSDEDAFHIHAVIVTRVTVKKYGEEFTALQPSKYAFIKDYEKAQDDVGEWFSQIGLVRGARDAAARRQARENGEEVPEKRRHVRTRKWRLEQEKKIEQRKAELDQREAGAAAKDADLTARSQALEAGERALEARALNLAAQAAETKATAKVVDARSVELDDREAQLAKQAKDVSAREEAVATREVEVDAIVAVADAVAEGAIDLDAPMEDMLRPTDLPDAKETIARVKVKAAKAPEPVMGFLVRLRAGWKRMRGDARVTAEVEIRETFQDAQLSLAEAAKLLQETGAALPVAERPAFIERQSGFRELADRIARRVSVGFVRLDQGRRVGQKGKAGQRD